MTFPVASVRSERAASVLHGLRCAVEIQRGIVERNADLPVEKPTPHKPPLRRASSRVSSLAAR